MDQSLFEASEALIAISFCTIVSKRVELLYTKRIRLELFLCIRNINDEKLVLGNYSYILEKLTFLRNFAFLLLFMRISMKLWMKCSEIHIDIFPCECILRNKFWACAN